MAKILTINNKDYKLEYTVEAILYEECTESFLKLMASIGTSADIETTLKTMSNIPVTTLTLFYAGLIEHHSDEIQSKNDAKQLVKAWLNEAPEGEDRDFNVLLTLVIEQMGADGFFEKSGLAKMLNEMSNEPNIKPVKKRTTKKA